MWPAHVLTLSRVPLAIGLWFVHGIWAVVLVGLAALTDTLDGTVARWLQRRGHTTPDIGGWLDPVVDKLFVVIALASLLREVDLAILLLLAAREILQIPVAIVFLARHVSFRDLRADVLGKVATVVQLSALGIVLGMPRFALPAALIAATLGLAAAVHNLFVIEPTRARSGSPT